MSSNRLQIHRDLESYLDELMDRVDDCIYNQQEDSIREISRLNLSKNAMYQCAAEVFEFLYFEDNLSASKALRDAAELTIDAAIYANLQRDRRLDCLTASEEDEMEADFEFVTSITDRDRSRGRGRDSRQEAASSRRGGRDTGRSGRDRGGRDRDDRGGRDRDERPTRASRDEEAKRLREEEERKAEERRKARGEKTRDDKVSQANENLTKNVVITNKVVLANPGPFCSPEKNLPLAPVYWLGDQVPELVDNVITFSRAGESVDWEKHRTDLYLAVRKTVKPSSSLRDDALKRAISGRDMYVNQIIEKIEGEQNVVSEKKELKFSQVKTDETFIGKYYGEGTPLTMVQASLNAFGLNGLPQHPLTMRIEVYPLWVMNKALTEAVEELCAVTSLNALLQALVRISNEADPIQWKYFHDQVTLMINKALKVELEVRPYLNSILTEWPSFANWIDSYRNGELISWFGNNLQTLLRRAFHVYKHGSVMAHDFVDGSDEKYASISATERVIYINVDSDNFGAASATKLGRVQESTTPKLYQLLVNHADETARTVHLVTSTDESVEVHKRITTVTKDIIFLGDVNWC